MPKFTTQRIVPYTREQMFDLVADVERYPEFLPLCEGLTVHARQPSIGSGKVAAAEGERIEASMTVGYGPLRETFKVEVNLRHAQRHIAVRYLEGPFRRLDNTWDFLPHATGCEVVFYIAYEFGSLPLQMLMGSMFDRAFRRFAQSFEARAAHIYGPAGA